MKLVLLPLVAALSLVTSVALAQDVDNNTGTVVDDGVLVNSSPITNVIIPTNNYIPLGNLGAGGDAVAYVDTYGGVSCTQDSMSVSAQQNFDIDGSDAGSAVFATYTHTFGGQDCKEARQKQLVAMGYNNRAAYRSMVTKEAVDRLTISLLQEQLAAAQLTNEAARIRECASLHHSTTVPVGDYFHERCEGVEFLHAPSPSHTSEHARIAPHINVQ